MAASPSPSPSKRPAARGSASKLHVPQMRIARIAAHEHDVSRAGEFVPNTLMIKASQDVVANVPDLAGTRVASVHTLALPQQTAAPFEWLEREDRIREIIPLFSRLTRGRSLSIAPTQAAAAFTTSIRDSENEDLRGLNVLRLSGSADVGEIAKTLRNTPGIEYVHPVPRRWLAATRQLPNDPMMQQQWGLRAIRWYHVDPAPDTSTVKVAVLDTGVDLTHPELSNIVKSYIHDGTANIDIIGHGTHVAGIISAEMNNQVGVTGICQCDVSVWKIFADQPDPGDGQYYVDDILYQRALNAARNAGIRVLNLSIGGTASSPTEEFLFRRLVDAGCVVVAAMGNEAQKGDPVEYPAAYPGVIAVGATTRQNRRAPFSNTGSHISISAPGVSILSTLPLAPSATRGPDQTHYAFWDGTSMATPHVSAAAAAVVAKFPSLAPADVKKKLEGTARKVPTMGGKQFTTEVGHGLLDMEKAL